MDFEDFEEEDDDRDYCAEMIAWLAERDPDVWFASTLRLNWDFAMPVLHWIVAQPQCDRANAAMIFWLCDPAYHAGELARGEQPWGEAWPLAQTILENWRAGRYLRSELAWPEGTELPGPAHYLAQLAAVPDWQQVLNLPDDLLHPIAGRAPRLAPADLPEENPEAWDLFAGLGSWCGPRPHSRQWREQRQ